MLRSINIWMLDYRQINVSIVAMKNCVFLERGRSHLSRNVEFDYINTTSDMSNQDISPIFPIC